MEGNRWFEADMRKFMDISHSNYCQRGKFASYGIQYICLCIIVIGNGLFPTILHSDAYFTRCEEDILLVGKSNMETVLDILAIVW